MSSGMIRERLMSTQASLRSTQKGGRGGMARVGGWQVDRHDKGVVAHT